MGNVISVYLGDFLSRDPGEIWEWLQSAFLSGSAPPDLADSHLEGVPKRIFVRESLEYALELDLGVTLQLLGGDRFAYGRLTFSPGRVVAEDTKEISWKEAQDSVLGAYLQLREAAGLALRMLEHRRVRKDPGEGSHNWAAWEHGLVNIFPPSRSEQQLLESRFHEIHNLRVVGARLIAYNERIAKKTVFRIPAAVESFPPLPREVGIAWSTGVPLQGPSPRTQLAEWLDVPAEEIVRAHANASR